MLIKNEIFNGFEVFFFYLKTQKKKSLIDKAKKKLEWMWFFLREKQKTFLFFILFFLRPISNFCTAENDFIAKFSSSSSEYGEKRVSNCILNMSVVINIHFHKTVDVECRKIAKKKSKHHAENNKSLWRDENICHICFGFHSNFLHAI